MEEEAAAGGVHAADADSTTPVADGEGGVGSGAEGENKKKTQEGETRTKRVMKSASQLEVLERTYLVEPYPSESVRAELSGQLGLSDRQLQMWFCHRRLKDRKAPTAKRSRKDLPAVARGGEEMPMGVAGEVTGSGSGFSPFVGHVVDPRRMIGRTPGVAVPRISGDFMAMKRYYEPPQQSPAELRAIAFVQAQLGEPLREDGPILGMEFDPLPPGAFGAPIGSPLAGQQKQLGRSLEASIYEQPAVRTIKGSTRAIHEYQFLPQQPTVRADSHERLASSHQYSSPADGHNAKPPILSTSRPFLHPNEEGPSGFGFPSHVPGLSLMSQEGWQGNHLPSSAGEYEAGPRKNFLTTIGMDAQFGGHPITGLSNPFVSSDPVVAHNEDILHMDRKRKSEEARIAREVEAHEKRIRKELEKQDILRRKREEQIRKEMERQDRERRKEEERLLREKQREEERYQREQRRELERREKYLQKESIRAEKMRQKEELRREKEAARQKAATEKAIARRAAKESMELVEDERLELMELACSRNGLPSILSLDYETLQDLDLFRDKLSTFPPKSVALKRPFGIQPWNDSEENVGKLLMVWRFLITFADVLRIWPFTLDEFVQAFHDYDPRLFGEIHISLLRSIIKDIEDGARTPATGLGANQNSAANPGAGHPQVVEGAYAWGFDVRSWQCHLNPLTWPEVLRQFALSAGFGPQLKRRNTEHAHLRDDDEGNDGENVINNLRNGVAVENAVALMHERGLSNPRRSRHRLTPGTVKFAAFHVLSLEGSKGLSILEVAEKIQKFGLRDLSTSKTPEASIAAALSRDSKLFERTAPSTYCVRPAYRKDPADAEAILAAAREKIQTSKVGILDGEEADDAERDEDSDSDVAEDPEVDDLGAELNAKKEGVNYPEVSGIDAKAPPGNQLSGNQMESNEVSKTPQVGIEKIGKGLSQLEPESAIEVKGVASVDESGDVARFCGNLEQEDASIDESNLGEPWVLGLIEGDYTDLSVEERLNALVALIGVAIEGNSIRVVLEERLEAASALKKQMWAEAQLDKRRPKEEYLMRSHYSSYTGNKTGPNPAIAAAAECRQSPLITVDDKTNQITINDNVQQERLKNMQNDLNCLNHMPPEVNVQLQDFSAGPDNFLYQQSVYVAEKTRSQLKSVIGHKAEEMYVYRSLPLGQDRRRNRYWQFITSASSNDPGCGRIFVELRDGRWRLIDSEEDFDALLACLDVRGIRESHLHAMLQKVEKSFKETVKRNVLHNGMGSEPIKREANEMTIGPKCSNGESPSSSVCMLDSDMSETSTSFAVELGRNEIEKFNSLKRYHDFEKWMWRECFHSLKLCAMKCGKKRTIPLLEFCDHCHDIYSFRDNYCPTCHKTHGASGGNFKFSGQVMHNEEKQKMDADPASTLCRSSPLRIKLLKLLIALIEASVLPEAFQNFWTDNYRKSWGIKLQSSSSAENLLQILAVLEGAIKRDHLSSTFETTGELLGSWNPAGCYANDYASGKTIPVLPWLPKTTAAVALRVMVLDGSISYMLNQKVESQKGRATGDFILPPKYSVAKNMQDDEIPENHHQAGLFGEGNWVGSGTGLAGGVRGRGSGSRTRGRTRGGRPQRSVVGSRSESVKRRMASSSERLAPEVTWKGRARARGARKRGRRSTRSKQKVIKKAVDVIPQRCVPKESIYEQSSRGFVIGGWNGDEARLQVDEAENGSTSSEYNEENGQATGDEYDDLVADDYGGDLNGKPDDLMEGSDYNIDDDIDEEEQDDLDIDEYINGDPDEDVGSISSDYSD